MTKPVTYKHAIAGSVVHFQRRCKKDETPHPVKTITFYGHKGGVGLYTTDDADEITELDKMAVSKQTQVEKVEVGDFTPLEKTKPPELAIPSAEVEAQAMRAVNPELISAQERLAAIIAATNKQSD